MQDGKSIFQLARKHIGETYVLGTMVPKNNSRWTGPWDCAEFVSWLVFQTAGILYGCENDAGKPETADAYTGYWARDAQAIGQMIPVNEAARTPAPRSCGCRPKGRWAS